MKILFFGNKYKVLEFLAENGETKAGDISNQLKMAPAALSHFLLFYRKFNLIIFQKRGREYFYKINPEIFDEVQELIQATKKIENKIIKKGK